MSHDSSFVYQVIYGPRNRLLPAPQSQLDARLDERLDVNLRNALVGNEPFGCLEYP
ncbi:uncharacterized protein SCHCODRAFT_011773 [Schizophyllum commune H4-8]|uniref:Expressed protein n=1 Tax=Schizophyllum commune (strain H4-8 / FGSC 9210) TaxID=578458 RepID=D8QBM9_SCHCM|nr:uncharacterized protein SCHCODRAFT_011773 [Schizophyllum commune H4-8]KAI5889241.1 hypothetical protein SCHCODRAFT_011773 [Schizophyllum commune H4-8]